MKKYLNALNYLAVICNIKLKIKLSKMKKFFLLKKMLFCIDKTNFEDYNNNVICAISSVGRAVDS